MSSKTHIYLRVSTGQQDADSQLIGITEYCQKSGISQFSITKDEASGGISWHHRALWKILSDSEPQDKIIVSELSRVGRSTHDVLEFLAKAAEKQVEIVAVKNGISFDGSINSKIFSTVLALAAEIERDFIRTRTKEGMANARAKGKKIGRPAGSKSESKLQAFQEQLLKLSAAGVTKTAMAKLVGVSRNTVISFFKSQESK